ncbi:MAG: hypothetical protein ACIWVG_04540 [Gloeotrichia echinulata HAB0833]
MPAATWGTAGIRASAIRWGSVTVSVTRGKVRNKVPNFIEELELYPLWFW